LWNGTVFTFTGCHDLEAAVAGIIKSGRCVRFDSTLGVKHVSGKSVISIQGRSWRAALAVLAKYDVSAVTHDTLLSADEEDGCVRALDEKELVGLKCKLARDHGWRLILTRHDWNGEYNPREVEALSVVGDLRSGGGVNNIFWIDGSSWEVALPAALKLTPVVGSQAIAVAGPEVPAMRSRKPSPGTIGYLFDAALPSEQEYWTKLQAQLGDRLAQPLFENGPAQAALKDREVVFYSRDLGNNVLPNLLVSGPTACGKTYLMQALFLNAALEQQGCVLYVAPTRALVYEMAAELEKRFPSTGSFDTTRDIVVSSGESSTTDSRIRRGDFKIALVVNEKANLFASPSFDMLGKLTMVVLDELHMLSDPSRGGTVDMLLTKIRRTARDRPPRHRLRYVGITTESVPPAVLSYFDTEADGRRIVPRQLAVTKRPVSVQHLLRIVEPNPDAKFVQVDLVADFNDEKCRKLDRPAEEDLRRRIRRAKASVQPNEGPQFAAEHLRDEDVISQVVLVGRSHKRVLVACASIDKLNQYAAGLTKRLPELRGAPEDGARSLLTRHGTKRQADDFAKQVARGVLVHHAGLPRPVRTWVEERFRRSVEPNEPTEFLLTTETLFYGVNLSVDCVVLTTTSWPREDLKSDEVKYEDLTPNAYHNIMGRAGRPGLVGASQTSSAIVLAGSGVREALILSYYTAAHDETVRRLSALLSPPDVTKGDSGRIRKLDDISYPTFRAVIDALRFVAGEGGDASSADAVSDFVRDTVYFATNGHRETAIGKVVRQVLDACADNQPMNLVSRVPGEETYKATPEAIALIETGTKWQSIAPMKAWLDALKDLSQHEPFKGCEIPVELLVPAFVATPNLWPSARRFCGESAAQPVGDSSLATNAAQSLMKDEFQRLCLNSSQVEALLSAIDRYVVARSELGVQRSRTVGDRDNYRKAIFCRLVATFLAWLRGEEVRQFSCKNVPNGAPDRDFRPAYAERASWLAVMCRRFFSAREDDLLPHHIRDLPELEKRLRDGIPAGGMPFFGMGSAREGALTRKDVTELVLKGIKPWHVVEDPVALKDWSDDKARASVRSAVVQYYQGGVDELLDELYVRKQYDGLGWARLESMTPSSADLEAYAGALARRCRGAVPQADARSVRLVNGTVEVLLRLELGTAVVAPRSGEGAEIVVRYPWRRGSTAASPLPEVTVFGALVLVELITRSFVDVGAVERWVKAHERRPATESVRGIVMGLRGSMPTLSGELRDVLLAFDEPGIDAS
jgi:hypothetical protein